MAAEPRTFPVSEFPTVDPDLDVYDRAAVIKSRDEFYREQMVRIQEVHIVKDKMRWCYRREGVNHLQNCRHLSQQYLDLMKEVRGSPIKPFKLTPPKKDTPAE
ncbi:hypothetical protein PhCBS80983_g02805 [Powellomyces hirtus]|uniref:NADH-ubiquinone oxidoreductase 12 kDa subunit n=1 Tax=Powellomyces hirtus TaxID=109895 RepID=A0A507E5K0_9FUNG|nr:hypothetical protein PhCBS80983_g02805 [Powellomyces hirtus]